MVSVLQSDKDSSASTTFSNVLNFLANQFTSGSSYSCLNTTRSALSALVPPSHGSTVGNHPLVKRLLKGAFNLKPPRARYSHTWDVKVVFDYLRAQGPNEELSLKDVTMKLVLLTALTSGQRCQTLSLLNQIGPNNVKLIKEIHTKSSTAIVNRKQK